MPVAGDRAPAYTYTIIFVLNFHRVKYNIISKISIRRRYNHFRVNNICIVVRKKKKKIIIRTEKTRFNLKLDNFIGFEQSKLSSEILILSESNLYFNSFVVFRPFPL